MAKNKKQHYVPKFYLRYFSNSPNKKGIDLYNLKKSLYVKNASIRNQSQKDYFYDETGEFEEILSKIEGQASVVINTIQKNGKLPKSHSIQHYDLLLFVFIMANRTKYKFDLDNQSMDKFLKKVLEKDPKIKNHLNGLSFGFNNPIQSIAIVAQNLSKAVDLDYKVFENKTKIPFITSDNPVVKYNQLLESRGQPGGITGMESKGLQVFLPINPNQLLIFYDQWAYKVGRVNQKFIPIMGTSQIRKFNLLQVLNCEQNIYLNNQVDELYIESIQNEALNFKKLQVADVTEHPQISENDNDTESSIIALSNNDLRINLNLKSIKETNQAKQFRLSGWAVYSRNREYP